MREWSERWRALFFFTLSPFDILLTNKRLKFKFGTILSENPDWEGGGLTTPKCLALKKALAHMQHLRLL